jgi:hypothetical protein
MQTGIDKGSIGAAGFSEGTMCAIPAIADRDE